MGMVNRDQEQVQQQAKAADIETDWRTWYAAIFGQAFVDALAVHHIEAIEWHWLARTALLAGLEPDYLAYFPIWSRGHLKSTIARRIAICDAARSFTGYCLYAAGTKAKVRGHAISIEGLLASSNVRRYYPWLSQVKKNERGASKGWTANFLYTQSGYVFHFVGLDEGIAGANVDDVRPTLIIPDDVDDREDSPVISEKRFHVFTRSVLPTRQKGTLVFFAQNLIADHSVMYRIQTGLDRVLTNRKPTQPIPAVIGLEHETREVDGLIKDVITSGTPTWPAYDLKRCQEEIDTIGIDSFLAECQHAVEGQKTGLIMHMFDEEVHVISLSQFRAKFDSDLFPDHWEQRHTHDVGYTGERAHPGVFFFLGVASADSAMPGILFVAPEILLGGSHESPDHAAERYLERILRHPKLRADVNTRWTDVQMRLARSQYDKWVQAHPNFETRMSHEALGTRRVFEKYGMEFTECNPGADGGIEQLQHYHKVDYSKPHPFKDGVMGRSNIYWVVADDQVDKARDEWGLARGRAEVKRWRWRKEKLTETGLTVMKPVKAWDDFFNAAMMAVHDMDFTIAALTKEQRIEKKLPKRLQAVSVEEEEEVVTDGWIMARQRAEAYLRKKEDDNDFGEFERACKDLA